MPEEAQDPQGDAVEVLSEDEVSEIKRTVMEANSGKLEEELEEEIKAAKAKAKEERIKQNEEDLKLLDAVKAEQGNEGLSDDEAWEVLVKREKEAATKPPAVKAEDLGIKNDFEIELPKQKEGAGELPEEVKARLKKLEELEEDKLLNSYLKAREIGVDFRQFLSQMSVGVNVDTLTNDEVIKKGLKHLLDTKQISQADYDTEIEEIEDLRASDKVFKADRFKGILKQQIAAIEDSFMTNARVSQERAQHIADKATTELSEFVRDAAGKSFYGLEITPDMAKKVQDYISTGKFTQYREDGTVDVKRLGALAMFELFKVDMIKALTSKGESKGRMSEFKERSRPSRGGFKSTTRQANNSDTYEAVKNKRRLDVKLTD